ncbi:MAG: hypothetical protein WCO56_19650 [Verrucomicrobiota bacterium]
MKQKTKSVSANLSPETRQLAAKVATTVKLAELAHKKAVAAKAGLKQAKKNYKQAKKAAKQAQKMAKVEVKALKAAFKKAEKAGQKAVKPTKKSNTKGASASKSPMPLAVGTTGATASAV